MSASLSTTSKKLILPPTLPDSRWITGFSTEQIFEGYASVRFKQSLFLSCARTKGDSSFSGHAVFRERWFSRPEIDLGYRLVCPPTQKLPDLFLSFFQGEVFIDFYLWWYIIEIYHISLKLLFSFCWRSVVRLCGNYVSF